MKRFLPLLILTGLLFGQDVLTTTNGNVIKGKVVDRTSDSVLFHDSKMLHQQKIPLPTIMRLVLADGTLIVNFGEFTDGKVKFGEYTDGKVKVDARKDFSNNGADSDSYPDPSGVDLRKIGHFLIGLSGVLMLYTYNDEFEFDESSTLNSSQDEQQKYFDDRKKNINNLALIMLAIGGFLNVFAEE